MKWGNYRATLYRPLEGEGGCEYQTIDVAMSDKDHELWQKQRKGTASLIVDDGDVLEVMIWNIVELRQLHQSDEKAT